MNDIVYVGRHALMQTVLVTIMTGVALDTYKAFVAHHGAGMD